MCGVRLTHKTTYGAYMAARDMIRKKGSAVGVWSCSDCGGYHTTHRLEGCLFIVHSKD